MTSAAKNGRELLFESLRYLPLHKLKHTPHPQQRSILFEMEERFADVFARLGRSQFRSSADISVAASLHHHYAYATGRAAPGSISYQYINLDADNLPDRLDDLLSGRWDTWCINDAELTDPQLVLAERRIATWLARAFPFPSPFEC